MSAPEKISRAVLQTWTGTDRELARHLGVTPWGVASARIRHGVPRPRKGLSKTVCKAIVREANRRGCTVAEVLHDLAVWVDSDVGPEVAP